MSPDIQKLAFEWTVAKKGVTPPDAYYCPTEDTFHARLEKMLTELRSKNIDEQYAYFVYAVAGEIGNNSFDHNLGNWTDVAGIFFAHEISADSGKIILADRGQGVLKTLQRAKPELRNDAEALKVAFTEKISGRTPENRGNGLKFVKENVENSKMHLLFISGNGSIELNEKMELKEIDQYHQGCFAALDF